MQNILTDNMPWLMEKVKKFKNITIPKVSELPPEAEALQEILQNQNIKSLLVLPIVSDNHLNGLIGFDWVKKKEELSEEVVDLLRIAGETIQSALDRKEIERLYQSLVESQNDLIVRIDTDFRLTFVNDAYCDLFRKSKEELLGDKFTPMIHEDDLEDTLEVMEKLKKHPYHATMEQRVMTDDGLRWIHWEYTAILNEMDKIEEIQGVGREITERKKAEKRIEQNKRKTERLHEVSAELETCQCEDELFKLAKGATKDILDFDICSFSKVEDDKIIVKERTSGLPEDDYLERPVEEGGIDTKTYLDQESFLIKNINKNEEAKPVKSKYKSALSIPIGKYGIFQAVDTEVDHFDEEDLKMAELLISHVTEALKRLETEKREEFLYSLLRHDVANKNRVIKGYLEMINDYDLPDEVKELMDNAERTAEANNELIEKVRKLRKIKEEDEISKVDLSPMMDKVLSNCKNQLREEDITIDGGEFEEKVKGGPLLEELFSNLIENSIQHSDCDEIQISCQYKEDEYIVSVEDDGTGISDEVKEDLFKKGFKGQESGGTGLGLYMVKEIAKTYCGSVDVRDSDLGGVKFEIHLKKAQ